MKKRGFTLSEVLIGLGLVGVIAALTIPAVLQKTAKAQIGPKLLKAKLNIENAVLSALRDAGADSLTDAGMVDPDSDDATEFRTRLMRYLDASYSGNSYTGNDPLILKTTDGIIYRFLNKSETLADNMNNEYPKEVLVFGQVFVDINGDAPPESWGKDQFFFQMYNDGSLVPYGTQKALDNDSFQVLWSSDEGCPKYKVAQDMMSCAGHIFENGLKAEYKLRIN